MDLDELKKQLLRQPESKVVFVLPDGELIPAEFHVTEVGHVVKNFIDCGGTVRRTESCLLQTWVSAEGKNHRLTAGKLGKILELSRKVIPSGGLAVEIEYGTGPVAQYTIDTAATTGDTLSFQLGNKKTDCLAREVCEVEAGGCGCGAAEGSGQCC